MRHAARVSCEFSGNRRVMPFPIFYRSKNNSHPEGRMNSEDRIAIREISRIWQRLVENANPFTHVFSGGFGSVIQWVTSPGLFSPINFHSGVGSLY